MEDGVGRLVWPPGNWDRAGIEIRAARVARGNCEESCELCIVSLENNLRSW